MNRDQKAAVIEQIAADISASQAIFAIDYRGITVAQADALRIRLREANASFRVVKNSLTERAAERAGTPALTPLLEGPTALTFVHGDAATAAKAIADFARTTRLLAFKGGLMDGAALSSADVTSISRLPSRDVLYGQLVGLVASPIAGLARTLNALIGGLAIALGGVLEKREAAEPAAAAAAPATGASDDAAASSEAEATDGAEGGGEAEAAADATAAEVEAEPVADVDVDAAVEVEAEAEVAPEPAVEIEAEAATETETTAEVQTTADAETASEAAAATEVEAAGETKTDGDTQT
jgi:large subunit ribosomal protein L10